MSGLWVFLASLFAGAAASMGVGGGAVLLLYLTAFAGVDQLTAQGINLLFFLPIAVVAVLIHAKSRLINYKSAVICIVFGLFGVWGGLWLAHTIRKELLSKLFAMLLLAMGLHELFAPHESKGKPPPKRKNRTDFPGWPWY